MDDAFEVTWQQINAEVLAEMTAWRRAHPRATLTEIEQAMDQRLAQARAASSTRWRRIRRPPTGVLPPWTSSRVAPTAVCPYVPTAPRRVISRPRAGSSSRSGAPTGSVRSVGPAFFPLDEHLALLPGKLTPQLQGWLTRLGAWLPFARAADL